MSARRLENDVDRLRDKNASLLAELGRKGDAINRFTIELSALRDRLRVTEEFAEKDAAGHEGGHALSDKEAELAKQMRELAEWSTQKESELAQLLRELNAHSNIANAQKSEIIKLNAQIESLKQQLAGISDELRAVL